MNLTTLEPFDIFDQILHTSHLKSRCGWSEKSLALHKIFSVLCAMVAMLAMVAMWMEASHTEISTLVGRQTPTSIPRDLLSWIDLSHNGNLDPVTFATFYLSLWRLQKLRFSFTKGPQLSIAYFKYPSETEMKMIKACAIISTPWIPVAMSHVLNSWCMKSLWLRPQWQWQTYVENIKCLALTGTTNI